MASRSTIPAGKPPKFPLLLPIRQTNGYIRALDFLEDLDTNPDVEDKEGWCQIKMMFKGMTVKPSKPSLITRPSHLMPSGLLPLAP